MESKPLNLPLFAELSSGVTTATLLPEALAQPTPKIGAGPATQFICLWNPETAGKFCAHEEKSFGGIINHLKEARLEFGFQTRLL